MSELDVSIDGGKSYTTLARLGDNNKCKRRAKRLVEETPTAAREHLRFRIYSMGESLLYESTGMDHRRLIWKKGDNKLRFEKPETYVAPTEVEVARGRNRAF